LTSGAFSRITHETSFGHSPSACNGGARGYLYPATSRTTCMTSSPLFYLAAIACLAVLGVLLVGVFGFARGGDFNRKHANRIMRLRLLLQFIAVLLIVAFVWLVR
jgi:hypothetical protein